jgi:hypothetical protein
MSKKFAYLLVAVAFIGGIAFERVGDSYVFAQEAKKPEWLDGMYLKSRKADEENFTKDTKRYGVEVFFDPNHGNLIYISDTGSIAVIKK